MKMKMKKWWIKVIGNLKFRLFIRLLKWFCEEIDQFETFQIKTKANYTWYVSISLKPIDGATKSSYRVIK